MKKFLFISTLFILIIISGCEKNEIDHPLSINLEESENVRLKSSPVVSSYFDWENVNDYCGYSMPWITGNDNFLLSEWKHSHPKSEGWELLYNTLDIDILGVPTFFALYNKYLGIVRFFFRKDEGLGGQKYSMAIAAKGTTSIFNFETKTFQPFEEKLTDPSFIKTQKLTLTDIPNSNGYMPGAWYCTQFEIAYEDLTGKSDLNYYLTFLPYKSIIQDVDLSGTLTGDIEGAITGSAQSSSGSSLVSKLNMDMDIDKSRGSVSVGATTAVEKAAEKIEKAKNEDPNYFSRLWTKVKEDIPDASISGIVSSIKTHVVDKGIKWATNPLGSFVDSVLGIASGSSANTSVSKVDLKIDANINLSGSITYEEVLGNFDLTLPGTNYSRGGYAYPCTSFSGDNLGVWTIKNLPDIYCDITKVIYTEEGRWLSSPEASIVRYSKNWDQAEIEINPAVLRDCDVEYQKIDYVLKGDFNEDNTIPFPPYNLDISYYSPSQLEPFNYSNTESYILKSGQEYTENFDYHVQFVNKHAEAHVVLVLKHKITGKIYTHKKKFDLNIIATWNTAYTELEGGGGEEGF